MAGELVLRKPNGQLAKGTHRLPGAGRPRGVTDIRVLARQFTAEAVMKMVSIMRGVPQPGGQIPNVAQQGMAALELLQRGWGRAPLADEPGPIDEATPPFTDTELAEIIARAKERTKGIERMAKASENIAHAAARLRANASAEEKKGPPGGEPDGPVVDAEILPPGE